MRVLFLPSLLIPLATSPLAAQEGCADPRAAAELARIRQEVGTPDVMCAERARGDVDGDGRADAVLDIGYELAGAENGGASRLYLLFGDPSAPLTPEPEPEEERGVVQLVRIQPNEIRLETVTARPDDPPCCPSRITEIVLRVQARELLRVFEP